MNKKYIIRKNEEIQNIINSKKSQKIVSKSFIVYINKNSLGFDRYCISVGKKIGKANIRNLYKRRVKDILMKNNINFSSDCVIIMRIAILNYSYQEIEKELVSILKGER